MKSLLRLTPLFSFILLAPLSFAQSTSAPVSASVAPRISTFGTHLALQSGPPVVGAPVSYERVSEYSRLLADGTRITEKTNTTHFYRDSSGRTRSERPVFGGFPGPEPAATTVVQIHDPVAGVQYIFDTQNHIAYRLPLSVRTPHEPSATLTTNSSSQIKAASSVQAAAQQNDPSRPQTTTESLGTDVIEGVSAEGHRTTRVFPVGSMGNDRPVTETEEYWYSPDLHEDVLSKSSSLLNGDSTSRLTNISRAEPDPSLFQPPANYQIVDGPADGHVTLKFELPPSQP